MNVKGNHTYHVPPAAAAMGHAHKILAWRILRLRSDHVAALERLSPPLRELSACRLDSASVAGWPSADVDAWASGGVLAPGRAPEDAEAEGAAAPEVRWYTYCGVPHSSGGGSDTIKEIVLTVLPSPCAQEARLSFLLS